MGKSRLLVVEDDPEMKGVLSFSLSHNGFTVVTAGSVKEGLSLMEHQTFDLVLADLRFPGEDGLNLLDSVRRRALQPPVIILTHHGSIQNAVETMRRGAFDYLLKPIPLNLLEERIRAALDRTQPPTEGPGIGPADGETAILTRDPRMKELVALCDRIAMSDAPVFIEGESGTGKELFARYIHRKSLRHQGPFVAVNCASLPETLFESELFGHEKGAFTGALSRKIGKFELAHQGTLLLDEVTEMSPFLQAKLLRVIQEKEVDRLGGRQPIPIDVRLIATTNRQIEPLIEKGDFREDLYFRLNVITLRLPPLRDRREDIELLASHFLKVFSARYGRPDLCFSKEVQEWLGKQTWRGNVRELKNVIERAVLTGIGPVLQLKDVIQENRGLPRKVGPQEDRPLSLKEMERHLILKALDQTNGNRTQAAKILGISIRTLRNKLNEYREGASVPGATSP
ncbi:MAG: sigma-54 dependent transcriptional regulator [Desulfobacterota bacterium]|nr:sigma-54 dependent transcriptional regulator [Thermodesulfobacteriota bacterium]